MREEKSVRRKEDIASLSGANQNAAKIPYSERHRQVFDQEKAAAKGDEFLGLRNAAYVRLVEIRRGQMGMLDEFQLQRAVALFTEIQDPAKRWRIYCEVACHFDWTPFGDPMEPKPADYSRDHEYFLRFATENGARPELLEQIKSLDPRERFHVMRFIWEMTENFDFRDHEN